MIAAIAMVLPHTRVMEALPLPSPDSSSLVVEGQSESRLIGEEHPGPLLPCPWQMMSGPGQMSSKCAWVRQAASVPGSDEQARPAASVPGSDEQQVCLGQTSSKCAWVRRANQTSSKCARVRRAASVPGSGEVGMLVIWNRCCFCYRASSTPNLYGVGFAYLALLSNHILKFVFFLIPLTVPVY